MTAFKDVSSCQTFVVYQKCTCLCLDLYSFPSFSRGKYLSDRQSRYLTIDKIFIMYLLDKQDHKE